MFFRVGPTPTTSANFFRDAKSSESSRNEQSRTEVQYEQKLVVQSEVQTEFHTSAENLSQMKTPC